MNDFNHLHVHTEYSILDGLCEVDSGGSRSDLTDKVNSLGQSAVAITDHGTLSGYYSFYNSCIKKKIKPIIGIEFYYVDDLKTDLEKKPFHLTCLAKNYNGLLNLFKLNNIAYKNNFYKKPRIDFNLLGQYSKDIIVMSACVQGSIPNKICVKDQYISTYIKQFKELFGDNYYFEVMPLMLDKQKTINSFFQKYSDRFGVKCVATNDAHYTGMNDKVLHDIFLCLQTHDVLSNPKRFQFSDDGYYIKSRQEMYDSFIKQGILNKDFINQALDCSLEITDKTDIKLEKFHNIMPNVDLKNHSSGKTYLYELINKGIQWRRLEKSEAVMDRLKLEFNMICKLGYENYFIMIFDICRYARKNKILMSYGRGSAGGSLICYLLGIVEINPLKHNLLFERFLNENRKSLPDVDLDFDSARRDEIRKYIFDKYGEQNVAFIGTYGTMGDRAVVRDISRVYEIDLAYVNRITKLIPYIDMSAYQKGGKAIERALQENYECKKFFQANPRVYKYGQRLEGLTRQSGVHACGMIVVDKNIDNYMPIEYRKQQGHKDRIKTTTLTMEELDSLGFLKIDILGLKKINVFNHTFKLIGNNFGYKDVIFDDAKVVDEFTKKNYAGVFQFDAKSMRDVTEGFTFKSFDDIAVMCALDRPGTINSGFVEDFIKARKQGVTKIHPIFDEITAETSGVIVYQEQVMQLFHRLAGMTLTEADEVRKIIGKKKSRTELNKFGSGFVSGCIKNGMGRDVAVQLFKNILNFCKYAFNKSHAVAYAYLAYICMWLKLYYPLQFMCGLLICEEVEDKIYFYIRECNRLGIKVLKPEINISKNGFGIRKDYLVYGFSRIKNIGGKAGQDISNNQPFKSFDEFLNKVNRRIVNKRVIEVLIREGAFRNFGEKELITKLFNERIKK